MRRYSVHIIASKGRFFRAGEDVPDDVSVPQGAEKYRIREGQPDESDFRKSTPPEMPVPVANAVSVTQ
jgi:hypothetical protein